MSRSQDEKRYPAKVAKPKKSLGPFVVIRPTKEERDAISSLDQAAVACWIELAALLTQGHKLTLGHREENGSFFLHLREGGVEWDEAITLSVFHTELFRCFQIMAWALREKYPYFPDGVQMSLGGADDW
jgi:hypothetical protein